MIILSTWNIRGEWYINALNCHNEIKTYKIVIPLFQTKIRIINTKHYCYLLESLNRSAKKKIYFGYTVDPYRRIRQHNGEIEGGAKKTRKNRPWQMLFYISGFIDSHLALQFEYRVNKELGKKRVCNSTAAIEIVSNILQLKNFTKTAINTNNFIFTYHVLEQ